MIKRLSLPVKLLLGGLLLPIILLVLFIGTLVVSDGLKYGWSNYAEQAYKPIDEKLIQNGFKEECSYGDAGHGLDNLSPWHKTYYVYNGDRDSALRILVAASRTESFELMQTRQAIQEGKIDHPDYRSLPEENEFIDVRRPKSTYEPYNNGNMELRARLFNSETVRISELWCKERKDSPIQSTPDLTVIETTLSLPRYNGP